MRPGLLSVLALSAVLVSSGAGAGASDRSSATAMAVSAGGLHTCALTNAHGVECWGWNAFGQLGDGTRHDRLTPVAVSSLGAGVAAVSTGNAHTCALTKAGAAKCWGDNDWNQLGDPTPQVDYRTLPVDVYGLSGGVAAIVAGGLHTCALTTAGGVKCWGDNSYGQLGDGRGGCEDCSSPFPVDVRGLTTGVTAIAGGGWHTCALTKAGTVECWGWDAFGELGDGRGGSCGSEIGCYSSIPVSVHGLPGGVSAIAAGGAHTCGLTGAGAVRCWGENANGQLGDGTTTNRYFPVLVSGVAGGVKAISTGGNHTCALTSAGAVECWGQNGSGQLGDGTTHRRRVPRRTAGRGRGVVAISAGSRHSCAVTIGGGIKCWGYNLDAQLGEGSTTDSHEPLSVIGFGGSIKCAVPDLLGVQLRGARIRIVRAHCRVGTVIRVASTKGKGTVVGERPRATTRLKKGGKVALRVSRGSSG